MTTSTRIKEPRALALLVVVLTGILISQTLLSRSINEGIGESPPALPFVAIGIALISLLAGRQIEEARRAVLAPDEMAGISPVLGFAWMYTIERNWRTIALFLSFLFTILVLRRLPEMKLEDNYNIVFLLWFGSIVLFVGAVFPRETAFIGWRSWWRRIDKRLALIVVFVLAVALLLRVWRLETIPFTLSGDEGSQGLEAVRVIEGKIRSPFSTGWLGVPTLSFYYNSLTIRLLGQNVTALRLPWVLIGTATVLTTFLLVKRLKGTPLALMTSGLLATYHFHLHFSRLGSNQIADPFFISLALLMLYRALDRENRLDWALTGVVTAAGLYFYAGARLTPIVMVVVLGYVFMRDAGRFWSKHGPGILVALAAFVIVGAPIIQYGVRFPDEFNARINQVGIIQSGWIEQAVEARGESVAAVLYDQFRRAALAFNYYPDRTVWYGLRQPLLNPLFGTVFLLGIGFGTLRLLGRGADSRLAPVVAWWWGGMILGGMLTESPPSSQRLITLAIPVCFFIALALWEIILLAQRGVAGVSGKALLILSVILFGLSSLITYFLEYTPQRIFGGPNAELATEIAPYLREHTADNRFYFVGAPWVYWGIGTLPYLVPDADATDVTGPVEEFISLGNVMPEKDAVFIFIPQRIGELELVQKTFPNGAQTEFFSPVDGRVMVTLFEVDR
jgi:hypothetical protein